MEASNNGGGFTQALQYQIEGFYEYKNEHSVFTPRYL